LSSLPAGFWELDVRLYDGWFDAAGEGTDLHYMMRRCVRDTYPTRKRGYRLFVEIAASTLAAPQYRLIDTFREQTGLTRYHTAVRQDLPGSCFLPSGCPLPHLRSWFKGRCPTPDCTVVADDVASFRQQKLVDTALVADLVWAASRGETVVVASDDEDVIPGLITAKSFGGLVAWASAAHSPRAPYAPIISLNDIRYIECS
jgi:hypothetical protein